MHSGAFEERYRLAQSLRRSGDLTREQDRILLLLTSSPAYQRALVPVEEKRNGPHGD